MTYNLVFGAEMIKIPGMLMVGAANRNAGKTEFICSLIRKFGLKHKIIGIKVTTIEQANGICPRGEDGCGTCEALKGNFCITEETDKHSDKDTCRMLAAGAARVFWLRALKSHLKEGITAVQDIIGDKAILVCESNSLRQVVEPQLFVMVKNSDAKNFKRSAKEVVQYTDRLIFSDGDGFDIYLNEIELLDNIWTIKMEATAIIMAGGKSKRMGQDKSMLLVSGEPMINHILQQLQPHFKQILISSNNLSKYNFSGVKVVPDEVTDKGPLMGIASALRVSANRVNFVIACDIPEIDISFVRWLVRESKVFDAVVPQIGPSQYEPLFAVYKKSALFAIDKAMASGNYRIIDALGDCKVNYIDLTHKGQFVNLNTFTDYSMFIRKK